MVDRHRPVERGIIPPRPVGGTLHTATIIDIAAAVRQVNGVLTRSGLGRIGFGRAPVLLTVRKWTTLQLELLHRCLHFHVTTLQLERFPSDLN